MSSLKIRRKRLNFVVSCSFRPLNLKTGHFTSCRVVMRTSATRAKMKNANAKRVKLLFAIVKYANLRRSWHRCLSSLVGHATFLSQGRQPEVSLFNLSSSYHIHNVKHLFSSGDDWFENLGEANVLTYEMSTSGFRPWLKNVACLSSLIID